ncbi:hypothetical protein, partial [Streptococcus anginosus]|uniref:hypothetical protein n=1 Tax=Streptococcus anginosus TaxID=1328 RepID=UPI00315A6A8C
RDLHFFYRRVPLFSLFSIQNACQISLKQFSNISKIDRVKIFTYQKEIKIQRKRLQRSERLYSMEGEKDESEMHNAKKMVA